MEKLLEELIIEKEQPPLNCNPYGSQLLKVHMKLNCDLDTYKKWLAMFIDLLDFKPGMKILDCGCGLGTDLMELANLGAECVGLEVVKEYCKLLELRGRYFSLKISAIQGDACKLPYKDESFDAVMSKSFFEHVHDVDLALSEQLRVLKKGGRILILDGNFFCPKTLFDLLFRYPIRTKGKYGGMRWLLTKSKVRELYNEMFIGRDEDVKTIWWWKKKLNMYNELELIEATTTWAYRHPGMVSSIFKPFLGGILIKGVKVGNRNDFLWGIAHR